MTRIRSFVAVNIDDAVRASLAAEVERLKAGRAIVRWVKPESFHLTLKFIGEIPMDLVPRAADVVERCVEGVAPFEVEFRGVGALPRPEKPRIVYADVLDPGGFLAALAKALNEQMSDLGLRREKRSFKPHLTLGRVKSLKGTAELLQLMAEDAEKAFGTLQVSDVCLMMSELRPSGAEYTVLHRAYLGGEDKPE